MLNLDKVVCNILGGYSLDSELVDKDNENFEYKLESVIPTKEALDEILDVAAKIRSEKGM